MLPITGLPGDESLSRLACICRREDLPITWSSAKSTSRWPNDPIVCRRAVNYHRADGSQHPFGNQATIPCHAEAPPSMALGFAPQPCDWFAFSRMMTLQALEHEPPSPDVGQALPDERQVLSGKAQPTAQRRGIVRLTLLRAFRQGPTFARHASTQTYVDSKRSQTADLSRREYFPRVIGMTGLCRQYRYDPSANRYDWQR